MRSEKMPGLRGTLLKEEDRRRIAADIAEYLLKGGKIRVLTSGHSSELFAASAGLQQTLHKPAVSTLADFH